MINLKLLNRDFVGGGNKEKTSLLLLLKETEKVRGISRYQK